MVKLIKTLALDRQEVPGSLVEVIFFAISYSQIFKMLSASISN